MNIEDCSFSQFAFKTDITLLGFNQAFDHGQAETAPTFSWPDWSKVVYSSLATDVVDSGFSDGFSFWYALLRYYLIPVSHFSVLSECSMGLSVLDRISFFQNKRDEVPNQQLAKELAQTENKIGIKEIADNLQNKNQNVQSDCLKVLYEIGYLKPDLISDYTGDFLGLLKSKNNRMVWGAMIALATIADKKPNELYANLDDITAAMDKGTLITLVWGTKALVKVVAADKTYKKKIFPLLTAQLKKCLPRDVPMHAESILPAIDTENRAEFLSILEKRKPEMTASQLARLKKVTKNL